MTADQLINSAEILFGLFVVVVTFVFVITRIRRNTTYRFAVGIALLAAFFVLWVNLAVGIIGEPDNLANLMYVGVLAVGAVGSVIAQLRPIQMSRAMFITAIAQLVVAAITLFAGLGFPPTPPVFFVILNGILVGLWAVSALMFRRSASAPGVASR